MPAEGKKLTLEDIELKADQCLETRLYTMALQLLERGLHDYPTSQPLRRRLGTTMLALLRYKESEEIFIGLHEEGYREDVMECDRAEAVSRQGRFEEAATLLRKARKEYRNNYLMFCTLGHLHFLEGEYERSMDAFQYCIDEAPDVDLAYRGLGEVRKRQGHDEEAVLLFNRAIALCPSEPLARYLLAESLMNLGRFLEAEKQLEIVARDGVPLKGTPRMLLRCYWLQMRLWRIPWMYYVVSRSALRKARELSFALSYAESKK
jgi:tetratricopeptide (TPR) repeat protein